MDNSEDAKFKVTKVVETVPLDGKLEREISLIRQRRKKPDGRYSREFLTFRVKIGRREIYWSPQVSVALKSAFNHLLPLVEQEEQLLKEEAEARNKARESRSLKNHPKLKTSER